MENTISTELKCYLHEVKKPYQYIGLEYLAYNKDFNSSKVKVALAFPDKYEIAISNLGQKIIYDTINSHKNFMADRIYAPDIDFRNILKENGKELYGLESKVTAKNFDVIGFSLQYELAYPTVLEMLELSGIPIKRTNRKENDPIIIAGGPCCYNPRPMENFIDLFTIGDGEELIIELLEKYSELKEKNYSRVEIIKNLSEIEGVYSPEYPKLTKKRIYDISKDNKFTQAPVPYSSSIHDRTIIEIRRGCGRMCRFCQAGHINLPIRERKAEDIISMVKESVAKTGYNEYSLLSLSSNDYKNIESVIENLSGEMNEKRISVSLPSQRIDRYSQNLAQLVRGVRSTSVTLAPEAGSQRLRNVINKNLTEEQIIDTVLNCYKNGAKSVKLYFMIGLPTETNEDLDETAMLLSRIKYKSKEIKKEYDLKDALNITCTVSIFVPKPFTPFQRCGQFSREEIFNKIKYLLEKTKPIKGVKLNYHNGFMSKLECAMTRGDKRYNDFIEKLHEKNVYLSTWDENIDKNLWEETALECGINLDEEAQREYSSDEVLPWDIIDIGVNKSWFEEQYQLAMQNKSITPCEFNCVKCGVCSNFKTHKISDKEYKSEKQLSVKNDKEREKYKYRLTIEKTDEMCYISHLDLQNTIVKMLFRSGLDLCFSQGFNPTPEFSLGIALPLFVESECELIDIKIYNKLSPEELINRLNNVLPKKIRVKKAVLTDKTMQAIDIEAQWALYKFTPIKKGILKKEDLLYIKEEISSNDEIIIEKINKKGVKKLVNIKPSIKSAEQEQDSLYMILKTGQSEEIPSVKPEDVIRIFNSDTIFKIVRTAFFDKNMNKLT